MPISANHNKFVYPDYISPLPADDLIKFASKKQEMYNEGEAKIQQTIDSYQKVKNQLVRDADKAYFDKSMSGLVKAINSSAGLDFSNKANVQAVLNIGKPFENDPTLIKSITSSANYSKMMEDYKKLDAKSKSPSNDHMYFKGINSWMQDPNVGASLGYNQYKPYADGVVKKWGELEKDLKPNIETVHEQSPDGRWITKQKISGVDQERFMKAYMSSLTPQEQEQLQIDAAYSLDLRGKDNVFANWQQSQQSNLNAYNSQLQELEGKKKVAVSKLGENDPTTLKLDAEIKKARMYRDATATRASKTPESISDSELISHLIDSQVFDAAEGYAYKQVESDLEENKYTLEAYKSSLNMSEYQAKAQIDIQKAAMMDQMGLSTSSDGSTSKKSSLVGFNVAKEGDLKNMDVIQNFTELTSLSPEDNAQLNNGITNLGGYKLSEDGKSIVPNYTIDKNGVRKNNSTVQDILNMADAENRVDVPATTTLTRLLGNNRESYLFKLKGILAKLADKGEEQIQYTVQEGDKNYIRKQRVKDFLKEDASTILPLINEIGFAKPEKD
jgi:hypothetical protein